MGKMWELDMQIRPGMSEAQKQAVQDARNLATTVLLMRYFGAFLDMAAGAEVNLAMLVPGPHAGHYPNHWGMWQIFWKKRAGQVRETV